MTEQQQTRAIRVPLTAAELVLQRKGKAMMSDTDRFEGYVLAVYDSKAFAPYREAMADGEVVEGSPRADDQEIARMCRDAARMANDEVVGRWTLDRCRHALGNVLRRFAVSRREITASKRAQG